MELKNCQEACVELPGLGVVIGYSMHCRHQYHTLLGPILPCSGLPIQKRPSHSACQPPTTHSHLLTPVQPSTHLPVPAGTGTVFGLASQCISLCQFTASSQDGANVLYGTFTTVMASAKRLAPAQITFGLGCS